MSGTADRRRQPRIHLAAFAFFLFLAIAVTWPLIIHLKDRIPGWYVADNYEYLWKMWWFRHAILELHANPLLAPDILFPMGFPLAHAEITPLHTLLGLPLTLLLGEIPAYNLFAMSSFVVTGWVTYLLVFRWTGTAWAGLFAGTLLVLNPYHTVRYGGILPLMAIEGLPFFLLGVEGWIASRKASWLAIAGLGYLVAAWASIYYAFGLLLLGPVYVMIRLGGLRSAFKDRRVSLHLAVLVLLVMGATVPLAWPYLALRNSADLRIPLEDTDYWSASPTDYLLPPALHPLWGDWILRKMLGVPEEYPQIALEFALGGGYMLLLFAAYGVGRSEGKEKNALLVLAGAAFILSLGPRLHVGRHPVVLPAPPAVADAFNRVMDAVGAWLPAREAYAPLAAEGLTMPLPALLLRWVIAPLTGLRAWNRFAAFSSLGLSLLAGLGMAAWMQTEVIPKASAGRTLGRDRVAPMVVIALALFELWPRSIPLQTVVPRPVDQWLAAQPDQGSVMELPLTSALSAPQMLYTRYHGKRITFAYGTYLPYWYRQQFPELERCPETECLDLLRSWEVSFVLLNLADSPTGPALEPRMDQSSRLERLTQAGDHVVYRLLY